MNTTRAVVLTSGGLDSTTVLAIAHDQGFRPVPLTFRYGQRHDAEVRHAQHIVDQLGLSADALVLEVPFSAIGGSSLLGEGEIPDESPSGAGSTPAIPSTYVPARNLVFLSLAVATAEARGIRDIFLGVNALDYSGYPDCRPEFIESFERTAHLATRTGTETTADAAFRLHAPLIQMTKAEIIQRGTELGVDYAQTVSCYRATPTGLACGRCDACGLRRRGFEQAGVPDPTRYSA